MAPRRWTGFAVCRARFSEAAGVRAGDPSMLLTVSATLLAAAALAMAVPAWRAARVDPMTALRED